MFSLSKSSSSKEGSYHALPGDVEDVNGVVRSPPSRRSKLTSWIIGFGAVASPILLFVLVLQQAMGDRRWPGYGSASDKGFTDIRSKGVQDFFLQPDPWDYDSYSPCGHTIESAREAGCKWSVMSFSWSPPECYDWELEQEFRAIRNWSWYPTEDLVPGTELDPEAVLRGDEPVAALDTYYHNFHCIFTLKKIQRALLGLAYADNYMLRWNHAKHCEMYIMEDYDRMHFGGEIHPGVVLGKVRYFDCVRVG